MGLLQRLKQIASVKPSGGGENRSKRRSDPQFGGLKNKDVQDLPPERAAELAGHAPERVDT